MLLSEAAFTVSMVISVRLLSGQQTMPWMRVAWRAVLIKLRVHYNHSKRKHHTKFFAKLFSHWLKTLFSGFTPSFKEKRSLPPLLLCLPLAAKQRKRLPLTLTYLNFQFCRVFPPLLALKCGHTPLIIDHEAKASHPLLASTRKNPTRRPTGSINSNARIVRVAMFRPEQHSNSLSAILAKCNATTSPSLTNKARRSGNCRMSWRRVSDNHSPETNFRK